MYIQHDFFMQIYPCENHPNQDIENVHQHKKKLPLIDFSVSITSQD